ncbi:alpha/beta fold hydrolase [uncultured Nocardioides sp.]|uniref:alpha/beta fold hydrolase n=1 Tax=uncultured Nocardioides sp. TaxID=198441 RepID=UPI0025E4DB82|nr:alpha/beta fold hydrolase [uncultured Nocardioides sp.]
MSTAPTAPPVPVAPGTRPAPGDVPGLDPAWSRVVTARDAEGREREWHVLDNGVEPRDGTLLCLHGNPTWSYLWRGLLADAPVGWRVVAPDHLGMGFSERPDAPRTLAQRVADLGGLTDALHVTGPVVTVGHDWGGILSLGWALAHRDQLHGVVLGNTAVAQPPGDLGPPLIRLARLPGVRTVGCVTTPAFVRATSALSRPPLPREVRDALALPYATAPRRRAVGDFVADIPFSAGHPSYDAVAELAEGVRSLDVPALLFWGPRDPVFGERYLTDLRDRLPHAQVHRFEGASHLVTEDAPEYAGLVAAWVTDLAAPAPPAGAHAGDPEAEELELPFEPPLEPFEPLWSALDRRALDPGPVMSVRGATVSWAAMSRRVTELAAGLAAGGVRPGDRVALLVEPSADLTAVVYAVWRAGAVVVVTDKGLGLAGMRRALRGAAVDHVVAGTAGLAAARAMGLPGSRIAVHPVPAAARRLLGVDHDLDELARRGAGAPPPAPPGPDADCAVVFTSGATGPAKGVAYRHRQVRAQVDLVRATYALGPDDTFVAAFAPFSILGPALGLGSSVPDIDVTAPDTLTAALLADAAAAVDARVVFASPAALRRVVATSGDLRPSQRDALLRVRLLMSAGAPVPARLLAAVGEVLPRASLHTPYGMTEVLPVTDVSYEEVREAGAGEGVCVGRPLPGVEVALEPLAGPGSEEGGGRRSLVDRPGVTGEICVRAAHVKDRYDALEATERSSSRHPGWHATGDVGHLDDAGRLWVEGRTVHVISGAEALVTPVAIEQRVESVVGVRAAAVVGVGPPGAQVVVVVVVADDAPGPGRRGRGGAMRLRVAEHDLAEHVRRTAGTAVAAVLRADRLPLDIRHASKVDRVEVARQAARALAGHGG